MTDREARDAPEREARDAPERKSGIRENERQLVMAQSATWSRRLKLVELVTLRKGNQPGKA